MKEPNWFWGFLFFLFLFFPTPTFAVTFTFQGAPSNILDNQSFPVNVTLTASNSAGKSYYIRGGFFQPSSTSYFGYTKNNTGDWYNGRPSPILVTNFFKITLDQNSSWSNIIEFKPDSSSTSYKGPGLYNFKIGRYTEGGSLTWCNNETNPCSISNININSSQTPTPTSTQAPNQSSTPTDSPLVTPTPTKSDSIETDSIESELEPNPTTVSINLFDKEISNSSSVLPASTKSSMPTPRSKKEEFLADREINPSKVLIIFGFVVIITAIGIFVKSFIK